MSRLSDNLELLGYLEHYIKQYPDMRFGQILQNFYFVKAERPANPDARISWQNEFYTEPSDLLKRIKQRFEDFKE